MMARAMAFAKYRAASAGMTAAMTDFSTAAQEDDNDEAGERLFYAASQVITVIRHCECSISVALSSLLICCGIQRPLHPRASHRSRPPLTTRIWALFPRCSVKSWTWSLLIPSVGPQT